MPKKTKTILLTIIGVIFLTFAILVWANATGRVNIWANPAPNVPTVSIVSIISECAGGQKDTIAWRATPDTFNYTFILEGKAYNSNEWWPMGGGTISGSTRSKTIMTANSISPRSYRLNMIDKSGQTVAMSASKQAKDLNCEAPETPCQDECQTGQIQCHSNNRYHVCQKVGNCYQFNPATSVECPSGQVCQGNQCVATQTPTTPQNTTGCTDSDGGIVKEIKGITSELLNGNYISTGNDYCIDDNKLREYYCTGDKIAYTDISGSCSNGAITSTPTIPTTTTPTPPASPVLNSVTSTCVENTNKQNNLLDWTGTLPDANSYYYILLKSPQTPNIQGQNGFVNLFQEGPNYDDRCTNRTVCTDQTTYTHQYESMDNVEYKVSINGSLDTISDAKSAENKSCSSQTSSPTPTYTAVTPQTPEGLIAEILDQQTIKLTWNKSQDATYYEIYNTQSDVPVNTILATSNDKQVYEISGLKCATKYSFYIVAGNSDLKSDPSNVVSATTSNCESGPSQITDQKVEGVNIQTNENMISLSWNSLDGATGYDIYNCNNDYIASTDKTNYLFTNLNCGQEYCFYVKAHDDTGAESQASDQVSTKTTDCPIPIGGVSISSLVSTGASLWFNILLAILLTATIGYFMFRDEIWKNKE